MKWQTSAPANLMLMGEHSVVFGYPALACAINQRLTIDWETRPDPQIHIHSSLGDHHTDIQTLAPHPKLNWVMACLQHYQPYLKTGLTLTIQSEFKSTLGLGSSAALLAALLGGLDFICEQPNSRIEQFKLGLKIIHQIQGSGSGTDLAASLTGGCIYLDPKTPSIQPLPQKTTQQLHAQLIYCGYKMPTAKVLQKVKTQWQDHPNLLNNLYHHMGQTTQAAYQHLQNNDLTAFHRLINHYQGLMDALGVNDATLSQLIYQARGQKTVASSKISGSGLGDCILVFFNTNKTQENTQNKTEFTFQNFETFPITFATQGLLITHE